MILNKIYEFGWGLLVGLALGSLIGAAFVIGFRDSPDQECLVGQATLEPAGIAIVFGEAVVCGEEIIISNIYGPTIEAWSGEITFSHNHD